MAEGSRSTKRRRTSIDPKAIIIQASGDSSKPAKGQEKFTRDADFRLEDGNVILIAGDAAFRVYRGLLAKQSLVFADMFATGCPDADETFDGCPVVRVSDHPEDMRDFLHFLMPCSTRDFNGNGSGKLMWHFPQVHAVFHLAHKYQCCDVEARALFLLQKYYTPSFADHDRYDPSRTSLASPTRSCAIAAVNIARLTDTPSMLPYALYLVCSLEGDMMDGYRRRDGSVEYLSPEDLRLCIAARRELGREAVLLIKHVFTLNPSAGCKTTKECKESRGEILVDEVELNSLGEIDVFTSYRGCIKDWAKDYELCKACRKEMLEREVQERRRVWKMLPDMFGMAAEACGWACGNGSDSDSDSVPS